MLELRSGRGRRERDPRTGRRLVVSLAFRIDNDGTGADHIYGREGDDHIDAGSGDDVIYPGPGHDTILGKGGNDIVYARGGQRDYIDCGEEHDIAIVDKVDHVHSCEVVVKPAR